MKKCVLWVFSCLLPLFPLSADSDFSNRVIQAAEKSVSAVVFVAAEANYFEAAYGPNPSNTGEFLRAFYDLFWPTTHLHGSGFFISDDGYIVTNQHVTENATSFLICTQGVERRMLKAKLVGSDKRSDIAVLKVESDDNTPFPYLTFADSQNVQVGEHVLLIGNPETTQLEGTVTVGVVSGKERNDFGLAEIEGYIQIDAASNPGNSGGPLVDLNGEVIGVLQFGYSPGLDGLACTIPSNTAKHISHQLIKHGKVTQPSLGISLEHSYTGAFNIYYLPENAGAMIQAVFDHSPAQKGGLQAGDVIVEMNSIPILSPKTLRNQIWVLEPNTPVVFTIKRNGEILQKSVILGSDTLPKQYDNHMVL